MAHNLRINALLSCNLAISSAAVLPSSGNNHFDSSERLAISLSLRSSDLPVGWTSDGLAGECIGGKGSRPNLPFCGATPLPGEQQNDKNFAHCLGLPLSHISMLAGEDELGEPFTYSSSTFTAPRGPGENPNLLPTAQSYLTMEPSVASESKDLKAFSSRLLPKCFSIEYNGPLLSVMKTFVKASQGHLSIGTLRSMSVPLRSDVHSVGYYLIIKLKTQMFIGSETLRMVIMGACKIEEVLILQTWTGDSLSTNKQAIIIKRLEARLGRNCQK